MDLVIYLAGDGRPYPPLVGSEDLTGLSWIEDTNERGSYDKRGREALARLVAYDHDPAETEYLEAESDPQFLAVQKAQRSYAGQYLRRLRRLRSQHKVSKPRHTRRQRPSSDQGD
jgi:hypothetical protein